MFYNVQRKLPGKEHKGFELFRNPKKVYPRERTKPAQAGLAMQAVGRRSAGWSRRTALRL